MIDLCTSGDSFVTTWLAFSFLGFLSIAFSSAFVFKYYYIDSTFQKWKNKINPEYPSPEKVRDEIILMLKGLAFSALCPTISLYLSSHGMSKAYCTFSEENHESLLDHVTQLAWITLCSDFYEWFYHRLGHVYKPFWRVHRHHHIFFNPTPFSVISDEYIDQFARATPLIVFPLLVPVNMELMFFIYSVFFYFYGVYLHSGHELECLGAHHPIINTTYQHYVHHAKSVYGKPYHTGFFLKLWDQMAGSVYPDPACDCVQCQRKQNGERTVEQFNKIVKPDYSVLWKDPTIWLGSVKNDNPHAKEASAQ